MKTFTLHATDEMHWQEIAEVVSFVGHDASGFFGIMAGRERFVTSLLWGLCSLKRAGGSTMYLAVAGGILFYNDAGLRIATRRFLTDNDGARIIQRLTAEEHAEQETTRSMHDMLRNLDRELLRHLLH